MLKKERVEIIQAKLGKLYPNPPIPLYHTNKFELLVAVLLSAQCTDERVNKVTPTLFAKANSPCEMMKVSKDSIYKIIRPCGLAPQKSKAISELSNILCNDYSGIVPDNFESLEKNSIDLYAATKSLYLQNRDKKINNSSDSDDDDWGNLDK